jgi:DNA-binding NarL/FixJ family response regulator
MKKINVTYVCVSAEEYPGCADLLYSYPEVNLIARPTNLAGMVAAEALAQSDVLVVDESLLARDGLQSLQSVHTTHAHLNILLVYENIINNNMMQYLSIGVRGLLERKTRISLLRRAIPALYAGEVWMPRMLVQSIRNQSTINGGNSTWEIYPSMMPGRGKVN